MKKYPEFKRTKIVSVPLYPFNVIFCEVSSHGEKYLNEGEEARTVRTDKQVSVYFRDGVMFDTIVHELFHVTEFIMAAVGEKMGECPNESWAYLIGWLGGEAQKFLAKK